MSTMMLDTSDFHLSHVEENDIYGKPVSEDGSLR